MQYNTIIMYHTECVKKSFTPLEAHINLLRGHVECFYLSQCSKTYRGFPAWDSYDSM
jgi:hypothetical protein